MKQYWKKIIFVNFIIFLLCAPIAQAQIEDAMSDAEIDAMGIADAIPVAAPGAVVFSPTELMHDTKTDITNKIKSVKASIVKIIVRNVLNVVLGKLAYDTATWIASGDVGQEPLIHDKSFKEYVGDMADAAAGSAIDAFAESAGFDAADLCNPPTDAFTIQLGLGLEQMYGPTRPYEPTCTFTEFADNWGEFFQDPEFDKYFQAQWDPASNPLGQAMVASSYVAEKVADEKEAAQWERAMGDFKNKTEAVSGKILTPGALVEEEWSQSQTTFWQKSYEWTGDSVSDAISIFTNTLISKLSDRIREGLLVGRSSSDLAGAISGSSGGTTSGISAAEEVYAELARPNFITTGTYDIISDLSSCPAEGASSINCIVGSTLQVAIENKWTVQEYIDYLVDVQGNSEFKFAQDDIQSPEEGLTYRGIIVLKKYRIVPVGWQLAAEFIRSEKTIDNPSLAQIIDCYDTCGGDQADVGECQYLLQDSDGNDTTYSPFCKLIDPSWVLKASENYCEKEAPGEDIAFQIFLDDDANSNTQQKSTISRLEYCADNRGCIQEEKEDVCTAYGYCSEEERIYRSDGQICDEAYASCQSFEDDEGEIVSYLKNSLNYDDCASDPGCEWYCQMQDDSDNFICQSHNTIYDVCDSSDSEYYKDEACTCSVEETCWVNAGSGGYDPLQYQQCTLDSGATCDLGDNCGIDNPNYYASLGQCLCVEDNSCEVAVGSESCTYTYDDGNTIDCGLDSSCTEDSSTYDYTGYCSAADIGDSCMVAYGKTECINNVGNTCVLSAACSTGDYCECSLSTSGCDITEGSYSCTDDSDYTVVLGITEEGDTNSSINFDNNLQACDEENDTCNGFIRVLDDTNLLYNPSFETYYDTTERDLFGYYESDGDPCQSSSTGDNCIGWSQNGDVTAYAADGSLVMEAVTTPSSANSISNTVDTGYSLANRTFTFAFQALAADNAGTTVHYSISAGGDSVEENTETYTSSATDYDTTITFPDTNTETAITVTIYATTEDITINSAQLTESAEWNGEYADYGENNKFYEKSADMECDTADIGCELYTPVNQTDAEPIPGIITNIYSDVCGNASDLTDPDCNQCNGTTSQGIDYYVGCDFYQEAALDNIVPLPSLADRGASEVSLIPDTGTECSADEVGCELYTNLDSVDAGGEGLEYYTYIKQCVKPTDTETYTYHTWEGSDTEGRAMVLYNLKQSDANSGPCVHLDTTSEEPDADCIDSTEGDGDCTAEYGIDPDCTLFYDDDLNEYYRYKSQVITVSDECVPLRNSLDQRVYYSIASESETCGVDAVGCREYQGSNIANVEQLINEKFSDNSTEGWDGAETTSNESLLADDYSLSLASTITYNLYNTVESQVDAGTNYLVSFWAKGDGDLQVYFGGMAATYEFGTETLSSDWEYYVLGPIYIASTEDTSTAVFGLSYSGTEGYIDNIILEKSNNLYLIKDSFDTCDGYEGCRQYQDRAGAVHYLKSFQSLCEDTEVGCEAVINTYNSTSEFTESFMTDNEYDSDDVVIPYDQPAALIYSESALCSGTAKGCMALGLPTINEQTNTVEEYETVYYLNDPDDYDTILCEDSQLDCREYFSDYDGTVYFKDPGERVCEYNSYTDSEGNKVYGWFKLDTDSATPDCPKQYDYTDPSQPLGPVCNGNSMEKAGKMCMNDDDCYPEDWADGDATPRCVSSAEEDVDADTTDAYAIDSYADFGWAGLCDEDSSGCSEYIDPSSPNIEELLANGDFEDNVKNNYSGIYYTAGATEDSLPDYWEPYSSVSNTDIDCDANTFTLSTSVYTIFNDVKVSVYYTGSNAVFTINEAETITVAEGSTDAVSSAYFAISNVSIDEDAETVTFTLMSKDASCSVECTSDSDCTGAYNCDTSALACYTSCSSNDQCQSGYQCQSGACTELVCTQTEFYLNIGESATFNGHTISLDWIQDDGREIELTVDSTLYTINFDLPSYTATGSYATEYFDVYVYEAIPDDGADIFLTSTDPSCATAMLDFDLPFAKIARAEEGGYIPMPVETTADVNIVFLIDASAGLESYDEDGDDGNGGTSDNCSRGYVCSSSYDMETYIQLAADAVSGFANSLDNEGVSYKMSIIGVSDDTDSDYNSYVKTSMTDDAAVIAEDMSELAGETRGSHEYTYQALEQVPTTADFDDSAQKIVVLLTDVYPSRKDRTGSGGDPYVVDQGSDNDAWDSDDENNVVSDIYSEHMWIYPIISQSDRTVSYMSAPLGSGTSIMGMATLRANSEAYDDLADRLNGKVYELTTADYATIFSDMASDIRVKLDPDGDGVFTNDDDCPSEDATGYDDDSDGCIDDTDGDGVDDDEDECPDEAFVIGYDTDGDGCTDDTDGDGITDDLDEDFGGSSDTAEEYVDTSSDSAWESADGSAECFSQDGEVYYEGTNSVKLSGDCNITSSDYIEVSRDKLYTFEVYFKITSGAEKTDDADTLYKKFNIGAYFKKWNDDEDAWEAVDTTADQMYFVANNLAVETYEDDWLRLYGNIGLGSTVEFPENTEVVQLFVDVSDNDTDTGDVWFDSLSFKENDKYYMIDYSVDGTLERENYDNVHTCLDQDTEDKAITSDGGCVAFRDVLYGREDYEQFGESCTACENTPNNDSCRYVVNACDTNAVLKVQKDRVCSQWIACETAEVVTDASGSQKYSCFSLQPCEEMNEEGRCTSWVSKPVYEDLNVDTDLTYFSAQGDTDQLTQMRNLTGYVKAGMVWQDYKMCEGGYYDGAACISDDDCIDQGTCTNSTVCNYNESGTPICLQNYTCVGGSLSNQSCAVETTVGTATSLTNGGDELCDGDQDGTCSNVLTIEGYYPYGWMYEAGETGAEYGVDLIEYASFEQLYCLGKGIPNYTPCINNSHCLTTTLATYQADSDLDNDPEEGVAGAEDNSGKDYYCPSSTSWIEFPFSQPAEFTESGWSAYIGPENISIAQYDNSIGENDELDLNNVLYIYKGAADASLAGAKYDLQDNIQQGGYYALSFKGRYTGNYAGTGSGDPSTISVGFRHNNIINEDSGDETENFDWFVNGSGMADVIFAIDTSGSMGSAIAEVKEAAPKLAYELAQQGINMRFGIVDMDRITTAYSAYGGEDITQDVNVLDLDLTNDVCRSYAEDGTCSETGIFDTVMSDLSAAAARVDVFNAVQEITANDLSYYNSDVEDSPIISFRDGAAKFIIAVTDTDDEIDSNDVPDDTSYYSDLLSSGFTVFVITGGCKDNQELSESDCTTVWTPTYYEYLASQTGGQVFNALNSADWADSTTIVTDIRDRILSEVEIFQFDQQLRSYTFGPIEIGEKDPCDSDDCSPQETIAIGERITSDLVFLSNDGTTFEIDDVSLLPVLEVNKNLDTVGRSCRAYANDSDKECVYTEANGLVHKGWKGYCLETDPENSSQCITWWPQDIIAGEGSLYTKERGGYSGRSDVYMCLVAKGYQEVGFCSDSEGYNSSTYSGVLCKPDDADDPNYRSADCGGGKCMVGADYLVSGGKCAGDPANCDELWNTMISSCSLCYLLIDCSGCINSTAVYLSECTSGSEENCIDNTIEPIFTHTSGGCEVLADDTDYNCAEYPGTGNACWDVTDDVTDDYDNADACEEAGYTWGNDAVDVFSRYASSGVCLPYNGFEDYGDDPGIIDEDSSYCFFNADGDSIAEVRTDHTCSSDSDCRQAYTGEDASDYDCAPMECKGSEKIACNPVSCDRLFGSPDDWWNSECDFEEACGEATTLNMYSDNYKVRPHRWQVHDPFHAAQNETGDINVGYNYGIIDKLEANAIERNINIKEIENIDLYLGKSGCGVRGIFGCGSNENEFWGQGAKNTEEGGIFANGKITITDLYSGAIPVEEGDSGPWEHCVGTTEENPGGFGCYWWGQYESDGFLDNIGQASDDEFQYDLVYTWGFSNFMDGGDCDWNSGETEFNYESLKGDENKKYIFNSDCVDRTIKYIMGVAEEDNNPWNHLGNVDFDALKATEGNDAILFSRQELGNWGGWDTRDHETGGNVLSVYLDFDAEGYLNDIYTLIYVAGDGTPDSDVGVELTYENMMNIEYELREPCAVAVQAVTASGDNNAWSNRASGYGATSYDEIGIIAKDPYEPWGSISPLGMSIQNDSFDSIDETAGDENDPSANMYKATAYGDNPVYAWTPGNKNLDSVHAGVPYSCIGDCSEKHCIGPGDGDDDTTLYFENETCEDSDDCNNGKGLCVGVGLEDGVISGLGYVDDDADAMSSDEQLLEAAYFGQNYLEKIFADIQGVAYKLDYTPSSEEVGIYTVDTATADTGGELWNSTVYDIMSECSVERDDTVISQYCGVRPSITDIAVDGNTGSTSAFSIGNNYSITRGQSVNLTFTSSANAEQTPLQKVFIDWGDGRTTSQTWEALPGYHSYTHAYGCGPEYAEYMYNYEPGQACYYKGTITVTDNWGWCSGEEVTGVCSGGNGDFENNCTGSWTEDSNPDHRYLEDGDNDCNDGVECTIKYDCHSYDSFPVIIKVDED